MNTFSPKIKSNKIYVIGIIVLLVLSTVFLYGGRKFGQQAVSAMYPKVSFFGEYKIGDGQWMPYVQGKHISATKGDVCLKGRFELFTSDLDDSLGAPGAGTIIAFYMNHLGGSITEYGGALEGNEAIAHKLDSEMEVAGEDMCGVFYIGYDYMGGEEVVITLTNPHKFGNERAVDEFLNNLNVYGGTGFENDMQNEGQTQRTAGIALILVAFVILGTAIFSTLVSMQGSRTLCFVGFSIFFAGLILIFSSNGIMFWSEIFKFNTRILGLSIMLYLFFTTTLVVSLMNRKRRKIGKIFLACSGVFDAIMILLPMVFSVKFFDCLAPWAVFTALICILVSVLLMWDFATGKKGEIVYAISMLPMVAFVIDVVAIYFGWWRSGLLSTIVFAVVFCCAIVALLKFIPQNIKTAEKAKHLEIEKNGLKAELAESRIAIMISQIQPHFIYNTLGTIEQLCLTDPEAASALVHNFSLYLRGNFSELNNSAPIRFSQEMNHVKHYTDIEQVRFPDMTILYDLRSVEFVLPALSVQPLVENAIKHGLMGLEEGGTVTISAFETDTHYVVTVEDDGVGFDTKAHYDEKKHVGIKNIQCRVEEMCGGTLTVESEPGKGTCATISIPKEVLSL